MKIAAAVLTYQAVSTGRDGLLRDTVASLAAEADWVTVVDNNSNDGTANLVRSWGGITHGRAIHTSGHGTNMQARVLRGTDADLYVLSDDDMIWRPGWADQLRSWWNEAPDDLALTGCHLEPLFHWNEVIGTLRCGGVAGVLRTSTGAASWSLRSESFTAVFGPAGVPQAVQGFGDVPACDRLRERGFRIAQIDLADHVGHGQSTWGNRTVDLYGWDTDPVRALLEQVPA